MLTQYGNTWLRLAGPGGSTECTWMLFSLLRDNVQHFLEKGVRAGGFQAIHDIADLVGSAKTIEVSALNLRFEASRALLVLKREPSSGAAISPRTVALLANAWPLPPVGETVPAQAAGWPFPVPYWMFTTIGDLFSSLLEQVTEITASAWDDDLVRVSADSTSGGPWPSSMRPAHLIR